MGKVIPRLQRFYGGSPTDWLDCPYYLLSAYLAMLPRLQAEESLRHITLGSIASGTSKKEHVKDVVRELRSMLGDEQRNQKRSFPAKQAVLQQAGIPIRTVPVTKPATSN